MESVDLNQVNWGPDPPAVDQAEQAMLAIAAHEVDEAWTAPAATSVGSWVTPLVSHRVEKTHVMARWSESIPWSGPPMGVQMNRSQHRVKQLRAGTGRGEAT